MENETIISLFPHLPGAWVGDVMPMNNGDDLRLYYLYDKDHNGASQIHPFYYFSTDNFYEYVNGGVTVKSDSDPQAQDNFGLGTGSYLRVGDALHCFYTGVNNKISRTTAIMHAVSYDDGKTWEKKYEETIYPPEGYNVADFRDSEVFWCKEAGEYWMTVSARCHTNGRENGVVLLYTSSDLTNWKMSGNLFEPNHQYMLECSDIIKMGEKYYLFYSWNCVTYYAIADSIYGPYKDPKDNTLGGNAFTFYAAKAGELNGRQYLCGWLGRKHGNLDTNLYQWGGNLVVAEIKQLADGTLGLDTPHTYQEYFNKAFEFKPVGPKGNASVDGNSVTLSGKEGLSFVDMGELPQTMMMTCTFTVDSYFSQVGLCFGTNSVSEKSTYIMLNAANNRIQFDTATLGNIGEVPPSSDGLNANSFETFTFEPGKEYTLKVVVENEVIALFVNGQKMLINRNFDAVGMDFGFFASRNGATFKDIEFFVTDSVTAQPGVPTAKRDISKTPAKDTETTNTVTMKPAETTKREETTPDTSVSEPDGSESDTLVSPSEKSKSWLPVAIVLGAVAVIAGGISAVIRSRKKR